MLEAKITHSLYRSYELVYSKFALLFELTNVHQKNTSQTVTVKNRAAIVP